MTLIARRERLRMPVFLFSLAGTIGVDLYLEHLGGVISSSVLALAMLVILMAMWSHVLPLLEDRRGTAIFGIFAVLLCLVLVIGRYLDQDKPVPVGDTLLVALCLWFAVFPLVMVLVRFLSSLVSPVPVRQPRMFWTCFGIVVVCWALAYLAMFPGCYTTDAFVWYDEFSDPDRPISPQWSPVYAGLFYLFEHAGHVLTGCYEAGLAVFVGLQAIFALWTIYRVMRFAESECGSRTCMPVAAFFALVPTHAILTMSTAQAALFAPVFSMVMLHLVRMVLHPECYWSAWRNVIAFIFWCLLGCVLRNNAMYALLVVIPFCLLYRRPYRLRLFLSLLLAVACALVYSGPVLTAAGVQKGTAVREMLSIPLQQLAYVRVYRSDRMTGEQAAELSYYVADDAIETYARLGHSGISDDVKAGLKLQAVRDDPAGFARLYLGVGGRDPLGYAKALLLQDLGLLYPDKSYPDSRMWHYYLDYESYRFSDDDQNFVRYIQIGRASLLPVYDRALGWLFGTNPGGYGQAALPGDTDHFSEVPLLAALCRASTWFWVIVFLFAYGVWRRWRSEFVPLALALGLLVTVALAPLVMYRYCAPVVFSVPLLLVLLRVRGGVGLRESTGSLHGPHGQGDVYMAI